MQYLLDTHVLLWWFTDPNKLSKRARDIISNRENQIFISSVSIWEMVIKRDLGKLTIPTNILSILATENIKVLQLSADEALALTDLPNIHNDPFDRMLITQAKFNDMVIITKDSKYKGYPIIILPA